LEIIREGAGWQKSTEKPRQQRTAVNNFKPILSFLRGEAEDDIKR
jgi:hypothetical protein